MRIRDLMGEVGFRLFKRNKKEKTKMIVISSTTVSKTPPSSVTNPPSITIKANLNPFQNLP